MIGEQVRMQMHGDHNEAVVWREKANGQPIGGGGNREREAGAGERMSEGWNGARARNSLSSVPFVFGPRYSKHVVRISGIGGIMGRSGKGPRVHRDRVHGNQLYRLRFVHSCITLRADRLTIRGKSRTRLAGKKKTDIMASEQRLQLDSLIFFSIIKFCISSVEVIDRLDNLPIYLA